VVLALSILYAYAADLSWIAAALAGVKTAVLAIVVEALIRLGRRALQGWLKPLIAAAAFVALFLLNAPFPAVVLSAGLIGFVVASRRPDLLRVKCGQARPPATTLRRAAFQSGRSLVVCAGLWAAPMAAIWATLGRRHVLFQVGVFFAKLATVTFGGAYAVLAYMTQAAVSTHHWLKPGEMVDGLGLAETTPGPLILVTEFVGFLAGFRAPTPFTPLVGGLLAGALTLWMTFTPCFLWIFAGAPFLERLEHARRLQGALAAVTAAVVGVIANLTVWFGLHVLFRRFEPVAAGPLSLSLPQAASLDWTSLALAVAAAILLLRARLGVIPTLAASVAAALALYVLGLTGR
jgi:chromate transporter